MNIPLPVEDELLVISDSWHPFWKAKSNFDNLEIIKANKIFKAIKLHKGSYEVTLYFDTNNYKFGIYFSLFWLIFCVILLYKFHFRKNDEKK